MLLNPWEIAQPTRPDSATTTASVAGKESLPDIEVSPTALEGTFAEPKEALAGCERLIAGFEEAPAGCEPLIRGFVGTFTEPKKSRVELERSLAAFNVASPEPEGHAESASFPPWRGSSLLSTHPSLVWRKPSRL